MAIHDIEEDLHDAKEELKDWKMKCQDLEREKECLVKEMKEALERKEIKMGENLGKL